LASTLVGQAEASAALIPFPPWSFLHPGMSILDTIAIEAAPSFGLASPINPGPFQFCSDPACPPTWAAARGWPVCQQSSVREIMRPIALGDSRHGLCDGIHRDAHEFLPA